MLFSVTNYFVDLLFLIFLYFVTFTLLGLLQWNCLCVGSDSIYCYLCQGDYVFTRVCLLVCLSVCLSVSRIYFKNYDQIFMKLYGMVGPNPGPNRLDFEWCLPRVKVTRGQMVKILFANNSVQNYHRESLQS